ncbi:ABC transporter permease [Rhodoligotrophos ferricapiens]|uniref:ABC transporter permease n=1 Tax=Rhodoligotrophos ferricapiens TaxID=3069264 RepID=UPI00315DF14E
MSIQPRNIRRIIGLTWMVMVFIFLFLPIFVIIAYSFNGGRNLYVWQEFSTRWYAVALDNPRVLSALAVSLKAAAINALIAVSLGMLAGLTLARRKGRWLVPYVMLIFVVLGTPELVSAIGQMIWLDRLGIFDGITRLSIGHSVFNVAVVTLIVRARAEGMGEQLEQAAADLGAVPWRAFVTITLPLLFPAVMAGLLLSFTFSLDNVITSVFVQRPGTTTLPLYILSSFKAGLKGDVAAIAVIMLGVSILAIAIAALLLNRGARRGSVMGGAMG